MTTAPAPTGTRRDSLNELDIEVAALMRRAKRVLGVRARLLHPDVAAGTYLVLAHVGSQGPLRASDLCERLELDKGAASRHVQHLVDLGLVAGSPDPEDGRATLLAITDEGRARMDGIAVERRHFVDERLADWTDEDLRSLVDLLGRLNRTMDAPLNSGG